ncbi:ATP-dependent RNA helicase [Acanthocystis turfacea Chlorella virus MO0605SPH]|nr:ATP-dependent RNA helicase [Acanthocystis turfacea Chlorella virus MO0605SPH]
MIISRRGAAIPLKDVTPAEKRLINKELIVSPLSLNDVFPKKFRVFRTDEEYLYLPRFWAKNNITRPITEDFGHVEKMNPVKFAGKLRKDLEQDKATDALLAALRKDGGGVLSLDTGFGKTISSIYTATKVGLKTLILVHKEFLAEQFEESIKKFVPGATISRVKGAICDTSGDFVICMIQTLLSRKYDCFDGFGTLILDEAHHVAAESFTSAMFFTSFKYVIALTATPVRKDGLTRVLYWLFGDLVYEARRTGQGSVKVRVVPFTCPEYTMPPPLNKRGDICYSSLISKVCEIPERTQAIALHAKRLCDMGKFVLVLSHRRQHAMDICSELKTLGVDAATYLGGDKSEPDCKVLCATYALASEGYDNPRLSGLVLATPSSDVVQAVGRILRGGSGSSPVIVDIYDKYSLFMSQLAKRRSFYKKIGFSVEGEVPEKKEEPEEIMFIDD